MASVSINRVFEASENRQGSLRCPKLGALCSAQLSLRAAPAVMGGRGFQLCTQHPWSRHHNPLSPGLKLTEERRKGKLQVRNFGFQFGVGPDRPRGTGQAFLLVRSLFCQEQGAR